MEELNLLTELRDTGNLSEVLEDGVARIRVLLDDEHRVFSSHKKKILKVFFDLSVQIFEEGSDDLVMQYYNNYLIKTNIENFRVYLTEDKLTLMFDRLQNVGLDPELLVLEYPTILPQSWLDKLNDTLNKHNILYPVKYIRKYDGFFEYEEFTVDKKYYSPKKIEEYISVVSQHLEFFDINVYRDIALSLGMFDYTDDFDYRPYLKELTKVDEFIIIVIKRRVLREFKFEVMEEVVKSGLSSEDKIFEELKRLRGEEFAYLRAEVYLREQKPFDIIDRELVFAEDFRDAKRLRKQLIAELKGIPFGASYK